MKPPILVVHWLASALVFALAACVAQMESLGQTGSGELQVLSTPQPVETQLLLTPFPTDAPPSTDPPGLPTPTPTPELNPTDPALITPEVYPTPTLEPFTKVVNLAEGLPEEQTYIFLVHRSDGGNEKYILPLAEVPQTSEAFLEFKDNLLKLGSDDVVSFQGPATRIVRPVPQERWTSETISETIERDENK